MGNTDTTKEKLIEIELAKSNHQHSAVRRYLPAVVLMASFYYSALFASGLLLGYLGCRLFSRHLIEKGKVDSIYITFERWKVHLHHWMMGLVLLVVMWIFYQPYLSSFIVGIIAGIIAHDVYDFNDWHRVLVKNEERSK